jgi:hypothetical protein
VIEDVTDEVTPDSRPEFVHCEASAECEDMLSALAVLDAEGLRPQHVQYSTDDADYGPMLARRPHARDRRARRLGRFHRPNVVRSRRLDDADAAVRKEPC